MTAYILDTKIKFKTFKLLQKRLVRDSGPTPVHGDRMLWEMLRDKQIVCWFAKDMPGDMGIGLKLPTKYTTYKIIKSRKSI